MGSQYCQPPDLITTGINPLAFQDVSTPDQMTGCQQASELMDSMAFRGRYGNNSPILLAWGGDVTLQAAKLAVYLILNARGRNPSAGADDIVDRNYNEAIKWCEGVQRQSIHPDVTPNVQMNQNSGPDLPQVRTQPQRGWATCNARGTPTIG
jgi:hypothetical protein